MKRLLITGVSGLLGLNLAVEAAQDFAVHGVARSNPIESEHFAVLSADLLEPDAVRRIYDWSRPEWVIHCAALANLDTCESEPALADAINAELPARMAAEALQRGARFLHISTDAVFDGQKGDYSEGDTPNPLSVYARTKLAGEQAVAAANADALIARVVFYGWSQTGSRSLGEFFYNNLVAGQRINGFTDAVFSPLLVNDLAHILLQMLAVGLNGLYHVFAAGAISKHDFGVEIARRFGFDEALIDRVSIADFKAKAPRSPNLSMRTDKLAADLGKPLPDISSGIAQFFELHQRSYPHKLRAMAAAAH